MPSARTLRRAGHRPILVFYISRCNGMFVAGGPSLAARSITRIAYDDGVPAADIRLCPAILSSFASIRA